MTEESTDRAVAVAWARALLNQADFVVLDTETTGLHFDAEIVQIAIVAPSGQVLLDQLIKPTRPIPPASTRVHGITDARVADAPTFDQVAPQIRELLSGVTVVIYNADYDTRLMEQSARAVGISTYEAPIFGAYNYDCAMLQYAAYYGDWNDYRHSYTWQPLPGGDHSAAGDALACLRLIQRMAGAEPGLKIH